MQENKLDLGTTTRLQIWIWESFQMEALSLQNCGDCVIGVFHVFWKQRGKKGVGLIKEKKSLQISFAYITFITPLSAQISAHKFQNLCQIPLKTSAV